MGKSKGVSKRRRKNQKPKFVHRSKLKKQRIKILKKSPIINCQSIRESWDPKKNLNTNLSSMGLSVNPNKTLSIPNMYEEIESINSKSKSNKTKKGKNQKSKVVTDLEAIANKPQEKNFRFGPETIKFCVYMIEKYGNDYKAMMRDKKNYYQESVGQIKQKINKFKSIPEQWNAYMKARQMAESENPCTDVNVG